MIWACWKCGRVWRSEDGYVVQSMAENIQKAGADPTYLHWAPLTKMFTPCVKPGNVPAEVAGELEAALEAAWSTGGEEAALVLMLAAVNKERERLMAFALVGG